MTTKPRPPLRGRPASLRTLAELARELELVVEEIRSTPEEERRPDADEHVRDLVARMEAEAGEEIREEEIHRGGTVSTTLS